MVDLGSDQTSCHDPFGGGYYPVQLNFEEANKANTLLFVSNNIKSLWMEFMVWKTALRYGNSIIHNVAAVISNALNIHGIALKCASYIAHLRL